VFGRCETAQQLAYESERTANAITAKIEAVCPNTTNALAHPQIVAQL